MTTPKPAGLEYSAPGGTRTHTVRVHQRIFVSLRLSPICELDFLFVPNAVGTLPVKSLHLPVRAWLRVAILQGPLNLRSIIPIVADWTLKVFLKSVASTSSATGASYRRLSVRDAPRKVESLGIQISSSSLLRVRPPNRPGRPSPVVESRRNFPK